MAKSRGTDEEILEKLRLLFEKHGPGLLRFQACLELKISSDLLYDRFGGWVRIRRRLGIPDRPKAVFEHRLRLIESFKQVFARRGEVTQDQFCEETGLPRYVFKEAGIRWCDLRQLVGLPRKQPRANLYTDEMLLADFLWVKHSLGQRDPTRKDYSKYGSAGLTTIDRRFGCNWNRVLNRMDQFRRDLRKQFPDHEECTAKCFELVKLVRNVAAERRTKTRGGRTPMTIEDMLRNPLTVGRNASEPTDQQGPQASEAPPTGGVESACQRAGSHTEPIEPVRSRTAACLTAPPG